MVDEIAFTKETLDVFRQNCRELNEEYNHNCKVMSDNVGWLADQFDNLFKNEFDCTPIEVVVNKRGTEVVVKTGLDTMTSFSTRIFEELGIEVGIMVSFNHDLSFMFFLDIIEN